MQGLVYIFIALAALGVAVASYFGLTFSPIEAIVTALAFGEPVPVPTLALNVPDQLEIVRRFLDGKA